MTPNAIAAASIKALVRASSVRIRAAFKYKNGQTSLFNMELASNSRGKGTFFHDGFPLNVVRVGRYVYVEASAAAWKDFGDTAFAKHYGGVWLKGSATLGAGAFYGTLMNKTELLDQAINSGHSVRVLRKGPRTRVNGQAVVTLTDKAHGGETLYVAAKGTPFLLEIKASDPSATLYFGGYDQRVSVVAPAHYIDAA
jgi:hypothetical protein